MENKRLRQRIEKLRNWKFMSNSNNLVVCKNCGKEYLETDNFNWSCRTHRSEFSGELWWCCGKTSKDALGCKFSKHILKKDFEDDGEDLGGKEGLDTKRKCKCCKMQGHEASKCPRDPNLKTSISVNLFDVMEDENQRIKLINSNFQKRLFADTMI